MSRPAAGVRAAVGSDAPPRPAPENSRCGESKPFIYRVTCRRNTWNSSRTHACHACHAPAWGRVRSLTMSHRTPGEDRLRNSQIQYRPGSLIVRPTGSIVRPGLSGSGGGRPGPCSRRPGEPDALVRARQRLVDDRHNNRAHDNNRDELHGGESIRSARYPGDGGGDVRVQVFVRNRRRQRTIIIAGAVGRRFLRRSVAGSGTSPRLVTLFIICRERCLSARSEHRRGQLSPGSTTISSPSDRLPAAFSVLPRRIPGATQRAGRGIGAGIDQ